MSDTVDIAWIRDRLVTSAFIPDTQAGKLIHAAMVEGRLKATAPHATRRPGSSAAYHSDEDLSEEDFAVPQYFWDSVDVNWNDRRPYFRFFDKQQVWLASNLTVERPIATAFLRMNDPLYAHDAAASGTEPASAPPASKGGRPSKYDWASAGGALAGYMYGTGIQQNAELKAFLLHWFETQNGKAPDVRDVEKFVAAALSAFEGAAPRG